MAWISLGVLVASVSLLIIKQSWPAIRFCLRSRERGPAEGAIISEKEEKAPELQASPIRNSAKVNNPSSTSPEHEVSPPNLHEPPRIRAPSISVPTFNFESDSNDTDDIRTRTQTETVRLITQTEPSPSSTPSATSSATMMPPPPRLNPPTMSAPPRPPTVPVPPRPANSVPLRPPPSAASSLRVPPTKVLSNTSMAPSLLLPNNVTSTKPSRKVVLEPGHSPLDWANLKASPSNNLRGANLPVHYIRVPPSQLKQQNGRKGRDAWTVWQGKVYNITPYLPFHPGGKGELMRAAGKEAGQLFMEVHPWVNWDGMLSECLVGILVAEGEEKPGKEEMEEMD